MLQYVFKRILLFLPTLFIVSLVAFGLSKMATGDPVLDYLSEDPFATVSRPVDLVGAKRSYRLAAKKLNLNHPPFYFALTSQAFPDTLHRIVTKSHRTTLELLIEQFGNWPQIEKYSHAQERLQFALLSLPDSVRRQYIAVKLNLGELQVANRPVVIDAKLRRLESELIKGIAPPISLTNAFAELKDRWEKVKSEATPGKLKVPAFHWHGTKNQYHQWMSNFLRGDLGTSVYLRLPVVDKIGPALFWTVVLNLFAITLAFLFSIPLGVWAAVKKGERTDRAISLGTFMLYSLPSFWIGTLLLIFFTSNAYGLDIFPGPGLGDIPAGAHWLQKIWMAVPHLILPVFCITYPSLAFISRQMRGSMSSALAQDFVRTARAKGLSERKVVWRHAFRNALFPIITLVASVFPAAIAGSLVIEMIFNIPGMGPALYTAILQKDWPIVLSVLMLGSGLTMVGILVADLLYAAVDPRVRLNVSQMPLTGS